MGRWILHNDFLIPQTGHCISGWNPSLRETPPLGRLDPLHPEEA